MAKRSKEIIIDTPRGDITIAANENKLRAIYRGISFTPRDLEILQRLGSENIGEAAKTLGISRRTAAAILMDLRGRNNRDMTTPGYAAVAQTGGLLNNHVPTLVKIIGKHLKEGRLPEQKS